MSFLLQRRYKISEFLTVFCPRVILGRVWLCELDSERGKARPILNCRIEKAAPVRTKFHPFSSPGSLQGDRKHPNPNVSRHTRIPKRVLGPFCIVPVCFGQSEHQGSDESLVAKEEKCLLLIVIIPGVEFISGESKYSRASVRPIFIPRFAHPDSQSTEKEK